MMGCLFPWDFVRTSSYCHRYEKKNSKACHWSGLRDYVLTVNVTKWGRPSTWLEKLIIKIIIILDLSSFNKSDENYLKSGIMMFHMANGHKVSTTASDIVSYQHNLYDVTINVVISILLYTVFFWSWAKRFKFAWGNKSQGGSSGASNHLSFIVVSSWWILSFKLSLS